MNEGGTAKHHPDSLFQPALSAFQPIASHATQLVRIRRRETPPGPEPRPPARREPSDAPRAAENRLPLRLGLTSEALTAVATQAPITMASYSTMNTIPAADVESETPLLSRHG